MTYPMAMGNPSLHRRHQHQHQHQHQQRQKQRQKQRRRTNAYRLTIGSALVVFITFHTTFQVVSCSSTTDLNGSSRNSRSMFKRYARSRIRPPSPPSLSPSDLVDYHQAAEAMKKESILRARRRSKQSFEFNIERQRSSSHSSSSTCSSSPSTTTSDPYFLHKNKAYAENASLLRTKNNNNSDNTIHAIEREALGLSTRAQQQQQQHTYRHSTETDDMQSEDDDTASSSNLSVSELLPSAPPPPLPTEERLRERYQQQQQDQQQQDQQQLVNNEHDSTENHNNKRGNPVVYRYFGRSRARSVKSESIPFIVLGPRVDHWKLVGRILSSRGFNVMACEQVLTGEEGGRRNSAYAADGNLNSVGEEDGCERQGGGGGDAVNCDGEALIIAVLDALKWNKAVLVGCDRDAVLAIEAALRLAPERIAGLVLCGDLSYVEDHIGKQILAMQQSDDFDDEEDLSIDSFLRDYVDCPCTVIWDGDASSWSAADTRGGVQMAAMSMENQRKVIIGGGIAPHRRLPEQFAWTLSRFVENKVSEPNPHSFEQNSLPDGQYRRDGRRIEFRGGSTMMVPEETRHRNIWREILPPEIEQMLGNIFSSGSLLVSGRAIASAIIYVSLAKVGIFQYKNIRSIHSSYLHFSSWGSHLGKLGSGLGYFSSRIFPFSLPVIISKRERGRVTASQPDSDSCKSEDRLDDSKKSQDVKPPSTAKDDDSIIEFDRKRKYDTERRNAPYLNFFTLDQVIS